ncbi:YihY family inner membrane protein [Moraxella nasicaprae]|uniref:UPF0761 membrane protein LU297_03210 n=1 Tax=Moraxella nasicaprae TaxID=2904122 RepID=A0ABY6F5U9_9GAMM|nr:YihY family inner membrane protein [Moraxella nasicaprae]UXZ05471.1 YihY family inner membrane protein [Moraxella nasicaprae]
MTHLLNKLPFAHHGWFMYLRLLFRHFTQDECQQKAASLTYTTLLSIVPVLTVVLVVFSSIPALQGVREQVQNIIYDNVMPSSGVQISQYIQTFAEKSSNLGIVGVLGLFVTAILTLNTIEHTFNHIWRVQERSGGMASLIRYWVMITLGPIVLGVIFGASSAIQSLSFLNQKFAGYGIDWGVWAYLVSFALMVAGFIGMYWFIPKAQVPIKNAAIAGLVIAILFETLKQIFGTVMSNFTSYEAIYGAFAALPIFLLWIYLSWNLILLGVQISYTLTIFDTKETPVRHPLLSLLDMLNLAYKKYQQGESVSENELRGMLGRKELPKWNIYLGQLLTNNLLIPTKDGQYTLKTDLKTVNLWQFYKKLPYPLPIRDELEQLVSADNDPWFDELYDELIKIEKVASKELDITLTDLFDGVPLRKKQPIVSIDDEDHQETGELLGFDQKARKTIDEFGNAVIIPDGKGKSATTLKKLISSVPAFITRHLSRFKR